MNFSIHINSVVLTRILPHLSYVTRITVSCLVNFPAFMITLPLFNYLTIWYHCFAFSVIFVIQRNYTNPKYNLTLVLYSFGKSLYSQSIASQNYIDFWCYVAHYLWNSTCVCVFIFFHRGGFFRLQDVQDILDGTDQRSCVVNISWLRYAKFHHRRIWKCHISPPKTKTPAAVLLGRKRYMNCSAKRWYILI